MPEEEENMIDHHLQDGTDIVGLAPETEGLGRVPEIEEEKILADRKTGNHHKLRHPNRQVLYLLQAILLVMFQQCTINTRYK